MRQKTDDGRRKTGGRGRKTVFSPRSPVSLCRRFLRDNEGQALLETIVALPVLLFFVLVVMELSMLYNAKQLTNYSAFCAARTASVYGVDSTAKMHLAAAMAMSAIQSPNAGNAHDVMRAFGVNDPEATVAALCSIPGFQGQNTDWLGRLANAYQRTGAPACTVGTAPGKTRRYVVANVTYVYRCSFCPLGFAWGHAGINTYVSYLQAFHYYNGYTYAVVAPFIAMLQSTWRSNIRIHGRAVTDYWAG